MDILPSWVHTAFFLFFLPFTSIFPISLPFPLFFCFSPSQSFIVYQFRIFFLLFPLFSFFSLPFLYYTDTYPPVPLYPGLVPTHYIPPSALNFSVLELFFSPSSLRFSSVLQSTLLCPLVFWPCMTFTPSSSFSFILLCITIFLVLIFTYLFFLLVFYLPLSLPFTPLFSPVYPGSMVLHAVFLPCSSAGL